MQKIKINQLRAFVKIVDLGSFREAAKAMEITQPAVSQAINLLETSLKPLTQVWR